MIQFTPMRTKRLTVDLRELSIDDAEALCLMPESLDQAGTTAMLNRIVLDGGRPFPGQEADPRQWTVQERTFVMAHYMAHTTSDGSPDFAVASGKFSDYLLDGTDYIEEISLGVIDGEEILMRPLLGYQAEAIERMLLSGRFRANRLSWWAAAMACQMRPANEEPKEGLSDADYAEWLAVRTEVIRELPESEFAELLFAFLDGTERLAHFFRIVFADDGIAVSPKPVEPVEEGEVSGLPPARFPVRSTISESSLQILGIAIESEG